MDFVFLLCAQDDPAEIDDDGALDDGADCYAAADGELTIDLTDDEPRFRVSAAEDVDFEDEDGDDVGEAGVDFPSPPATT